MTRKHFRAFADAIAKITNDAERRRVAELIANVCADDQPAFNYGAFYKACNLKHQMFCDAF